MLVDSIYKVSAFGDFEGVAVTPENILFFMEAFKDKGLVPTVIQELKLEPTNLLDGGQVISMPFGSNTLPIQRLALFSGDGQEECIIGTNRMDYEIKVVENKEIDDSEMKVYNERIVVAFDTVFNKFSIASTRLALNTVSLLVDLSEDEVKSFIAKFSNPISMYSDPTQVSEWATHLMIRNDVVFGKSSETINIITDISRIKAQKKGTDILKDAFHISLDINTIAEKSAPRFVADEIKEFLDLVGSARKSIIDDIRC